MKQFRKILFWIHLVCGVTAGAVILIMSVTGVLLAFEKQITTWADTRTIEAPGSTSESRSLADVLGNLAKSEEKSPTAVTKLLDKPGVLTVAFGREKTIYVDAATGNVLSQGSEKTKSFFRGVTDLHRWLAASGDGRSIGRAVTGASNLAFLFLVLSGLYLWFPRRWNPASLRNAMLFRRGLSGKARDFNWHNVIGFWSALPLAVIVTSGVVISYPWAGNLVYRIAGETPPARRGEGAPSPNGERRSRSSGEANPQAPSSGRASENTPVDFAAIPLETILTQAEAAHPASRSISVQLPEGAKDISVTADSGNGRQPQKRTKLTFSPQGELTKTEPFSSGTTGARARSILRFAHTGEVAGLPGQIIAGLASAGAAFLVYTGLALAYRRWRGRKPEAAAGRLQPESARQAELISSVKAP